jgi:branched-chain amino acid transport system ATP-binding protein
MAMLEIKELTKYFGGLAALQNLFFDVDEGEIRGVIGPNGAGKTTLFNVISGLFLPTSGSILFERTQICGSKPSFRGRRSWGLKTNERAELGLVRTFQRTALFHDFSVLGNVTIARHLHAKEGVFGAVFGTARRLEKENKERALEIVEFIGLGHIKDEPASSLPHGHQRALGVAIALAAEPKLLMLDEPVTGMNPTETQNMTDLIRKVRDEWGVTILLVEHDMRTVMGLCEKVTVLNFGEKLAEGSPQEITENKGVIEAYLGAEDVVT